MFALTPLLAQARLFWGYSLESVLVAIVVIAAAVGLVYVALRQFGIQIPEFVRTVFWIVVCCFLVVMAIRLVFSM